MKTIITSFEPRILVDTPRTIRLTAAETERHDEGDPAVLAFARKRAAAASRQRAAWNVTAARARLPRTTTRVDIVDCTGRYLGHEEVSHG